MTNNPETLVSYNALKMRLITQFDRCDRKTILAYLGRPKTRQTETIDHTVTYSKSGTTTNKVHTFIHKLPPKKGYVEIYGLAALQTDFETVLLSDFKTGKVMFKLFHTRQTELPEVQSPLETPLFLFKGKNLIRPSSFGPSFVARRWTPSFRSSVVPSVKGGLKFNQLIKYLPQSEI